MPGRLICTHGVSQHRTVRKFQILHLQLAVQYALNSGCNGRGAITVGAPDSAGTTRFAGQRG